MGVCRVFTSLDPKVYKFIRGGESVVRRAVTEVGMLFLLIRYHLAHPKLFHSMPTTILFHDPS
jgi:hypothetical protein